MNQRRHALARIAAATMFVGCGPDPAAAASLTERMAAMFDGPKGRLSVVLVDTTASISTADKQLYEGAMQAILAHARPGDRIVLAAVNDRPGSGFVAYADHGFRFDGNSMHDEARARRTRAAVHADFVKLCADNPAPAKATLLIDAVAAVGEIFAQGRAKGQTLQLLLLSDMIEESPTANFARETITPALTERLLEGQRRRGLLPDLKGVLVHVVGAAGTDAAHMARIRGFWQAYFATAGGKLSAYGRTVGSFAEQ